MCKMIKVESCGKCDYSAGRGFLSQLRMCKKLWERNGCVKVFPINDQSKILSNCPLDDYPEEKKIEGDNSPDSNLEIKRTDQTHMLEKCRDFTKTGEWKAGFFYPNCFDDLVTQGLINQYGRITAAGRVALFLMGKGEDQTDSKAVQTFKIDLSKGKSTQDLVEMLKESPLDPMHPERKL